MIDFALSEYAGLSLKQSPVNSMTASFSKDFREKIDINLGVGYVNDKTIPYQEIENCLHTVLHSSEIYRSPLNYGAACGTENLHNAIKQYYCNNKIGGFSIHDFDDKAIVIGANGATSILDAFSDLLPKGIVITADPMYYIYTETLERKGFTICAIPEDSEGISIDLLEQKLKEISISDISYFYIVTVNNPSTVILENSRKKRIVEIATELSLKLGRKIPVIFDKAYEDIIYDSSVKSPISGLFYDTLGIVFEVGTFSKIVAPALRIGYVIAQKSKFVDVLIQKISDVGFSAPLINQEITACFIEKYIDSYANKIKIGYREKSKKICELLHLHVGEYLEEILGGKASFYLYLTFKTIQTHTKSDFFKFLSRQTGVKSIDGFPEKKSRLIYVPGEFCVHSQGMLKEKGKRQLRLSFGFEDISELEKSVILIKNAVEYALDKQK